MECQTGPDLQRGWGPMLHLPVLPSLCCSRQGSLSWAFSEVSRVVCRVAGRVSAKYGMQSIVKAAGLWLRTISIVGLVIWLANFLCVYVALLIPVEPLCTWDAGNLLIMPIFLWLVHIYACAAFSLHGCRRSSISRLFQAEVCLVSGVVMVSWAVA